MPASKTRPKGSAPASKTRQKNSAPGVPLLQDPLRLLIAVSIFFSSALVLWVIWSNKFIILQDLPSHIARASILKDYFFSSFIRANFRIVHFPVPYLLPDLVNAVLLTVFDPYTVSKLFATLSSASMVLGVAYFVHRTNRGKMELVLFAFALVFTNIYLKGNLNFIAGVGALFFIMGWWWPIRWRLSVRQQILFSIAGVVLYSIHLVALFAAFVVAGVSFIVHSVKTRKLDLGQLLPALPALGLMIAFMLWNGSGGDAPPSTEAASQLRDLFKTISEKWLTFTGLFNALSEYDYAFYLPALVICLFGFIGFLKKSAFSERTIVFLSLIFMVLVLPREIHPIIVRPDERMLLVTLLWALMVYDIPFRKGQRLWRAGVVVVFLTTGIVQNVKIQQFTSQLNIEASKRYTLFHMIPPNSIVASLPYCERRCFQHFDKYLIGENQSVVEGLFTIKPYCVRYRHKLPEIPFPPEISPEILKSYDYFIAQGLDDKITDLVYHRRLLKVVWCSDTTALLANLTRAPGR